MVGLHVFLDAIVFKPGHAQKIPGELLGFHGSCTENKQIEIATQKNLCFFFLKKEPFRVFDNACPSAFLWQVFCSTYFYTAMPGTYVFS